MNVPIPMNAPIPYLSLISRPGTSSGLLEAQNRAAPYPAPRAPAEDFRVTLAQMHADAQSLYCVPSAIEIKGKSFAEALQMMIDRAAQNVPPGYSRTARGWYAGVLAALPGLLKNPDTKIRLEGADNRFHDLREFLFEGCQDHLDGPSLARSYMWGDNAMLLARAQHAVLDGLAHSAMLMAEHGYEIEGDDD